MARDQPPASSPPPQLSQTPDSRENRIRQRLRLVGPGPVVFFEDACRLMRADPPLATATHLVAHLLREVESALRDVLETISAREARGQEGKKGDDHIREVKAVLAALEVPETHPVAGTWLTLATRDGGLHNWAHRASLQPPRTIAMEFQELWSQVLSILDFILERLESSYLRYLPVLDALLTKSEPSKADIAQLSGHVPGSLVLRRYFFDKLESPLWLPALEEAGFFAHPPAPEDDPERGVTSLPPWPESGYLARMAKIPEARDRVLDIALKIPDSGNSRVQSDLIELALNLPPEQAGQLVSTAKGWLATPYKLFIEHKLGDFLLHLLRGAEVDASIDLARAVFEPLPGPTSQARGHFEEWRYRELAKSFFPVLIEIAGRRALDLFSDLLETAAEVSRGARESAPHDHSYIWRPAIEDHPQNYRHGIPTVLVSAVRDAAEDLARRDSSSVPSLVTSLEARRWHVFHRIVLHLLRIFPDAALEQVARLLTDRTVFDEPAYRHEYSLLARDRFRHLTPSRQKQMLGWIEEGPDAERYVERARRASGEEPASEQVDRYKKSWQIKRLAPISEHLPPEWSTRYDELVDEFGSPEHPEFVAHHTGVWVGPTSPKNRDELSSLSVDELVVFLKSWTRPDEWFAPSPEGLGRALTQVVAENPEPYAVSAERFRGLDPTYVRAIVRGLHEALQKKTTFEWEAVLELCGWVVAQPHELTDRSEDDDVDPHWGWARRAIADLLGAGLAADGKALKPEVRPTVWGILEPLTHDPDPTPEDEAPTEGRELDPPTLAINTTRGAAMHTVIRYALWARRESDKRANDQARSRGGFDEMPEVREVLDQHLDRARDPSLAIRSVYGQLFPWLVTLDREWAEAHLDDIFPDSEDQRPLWSAAWDAYVTFCPVYDNVVEMLPDKYRLAASRLPADIPDSRANSLAVERYAEHLMTLYWRGVLELEDETMTLFFARAGDTIRAHAVSFIGRSAEASKEPIQAEVAVRLQSLWRWRLGTALEDPDRHRQELGAFASWFVSRQFDLDWSLDQLLTSMEAASNIEAEHLTLEALAAVAAERPHKAVRALSLFLDTEHGDWLPLSRGEFGRILTSALDSGDGEARTLAKEVVSRLVTRGFFEYQELLGEE